VGEDTGSPGIIQRAQCVCWGRKKERTRGLPLPSLAWDIWDSYPRGSGALATHREGSFGFNHACTLGNELWRMEGEQIVVSEAHEREWSMHAQVRKMCRVNCTCDACNLEI
jgi:hypothetical protein